MEAGGFFPVSVLDRRRNARTGAPQSQVSLVLATRPPAGRRPQERSPPPMLDHEVLRNALSREFARIAVFPGRAHAWRTGAAHAASLGYAPDSFAELPEPARESFCGIAHALDEAAITSGLTVVDVGCGAGADLLLAARRVGEAGQAVGVEMTEELYKKASLAVKKARLGNARVERGRAEELPLLNASADVVMANAVINALVADKPKALLEAHRVLRPGGHLLLADVVVARTAPAAERAVPGSWSGGLMGPVPAQELLSLVSEAGFARASIKVGSAAFEGTPQQEAARAAGARSCVVVAKKPEPS